MTCLLLSSCTHTIILVLPSKPEVVSRLRGGLPSVVVAVPGGESKHAQGVGIFGFAQEEEEQQQQLTAARIQIRSRSV
jgi:hypothetical protein